MSRHTQEPWQVTPDKIRIQTSEEAEDFQIADCCDSIYSPPDKECEANARRIVACVNACEGIPTEALEGGVVKELVEACKELCAYCEKQAIWDKTGGAYYKAKQALAKAEAKQ